MNETRGQWLTTSQASARLGISERTVQRHAAAGKLTARKVVTGDGEKWEINLGADSDAKEVPTGDAIGDATNHAQNAIGGDIGDKVTPSSADSDAIGDATGETAFLRGQLDAMNEALKREQSAHEQTRQLLAGALQMASRQLPNATPTDAPQRDESRVCEPMTANDSSGAQIGVNRRGEGLRLLRAGLLAMFTNERR